MTAPLGACTLARCSCCRATHRARCASSSLSASRWTAARASRWQAGQSPAASTRIGRVAQRWQRAATRSGCMRRASTWASTTPLTRSARGGLVRLTPWAGRAPRRGGVSPRGCPCGKLQAQRHHHDVTGRHNGRVSQSGARPPCDANCEARTCSSTSCAPEEASARLQTGRSSKRSSTSWSKPCCERRSRRARPLGSSSWSGTKRRSPDSRRPRHKAPPSCAALVVVVCAHPQISDVWVEYAAIASLLLHLEANDLGLGSCWVQVRLREHDGQRSAAEYITEVLGLDRGMAVEAMVAIGYPAETKAGHPTPSLPYDKVSFEKYGRR